MSDPLLIAQGDEPLYLLPALSNRHGLIAGATGTGKTVTLQVMAEGFSRIGVPVFAADVKGDLSGISQPGKDNPKIAERVKKLNLRTSALRAAQSHSGMSLASRDILCARLSLKWDRCFSAAC